MQGSFSDLFHLGDCVLPADTVSGSDSIELDRITEEEDRILIKQVPPTEVQAWCLTRIIEHQNRNRLLRESCGPASRGDICRVKAYVRALRIEYNSFAPINRLLPPEVLMEIFSNVHPAVTTRRHVPVLRVCHYWRRLILKTPQFWANLLSLPVFHPLNSDRDVRRFTAVLALSAPQSLALSLPLRSSDVVDILIPHASRIASLSVDPRSDAKVIKPILEQHMLRLRHLVIANCSNSSEPLMLNFHRYPNIRYLQLHLTISCSPATPCAYLLHLRLAHCAVHAWRTAGSVHSLGSMHDALELFPNLETLSLVYSLSEAHWFEDLPELTKTIHFPRLRRIEIEDEPSFIPQFLSHLVFPSTTSLVLEPAYRFAFDDPVRVPLFPGIGPSPAPDASEISVHLDFQSSEGPAHWETHGEGTRPVRITLAAAARNFETISHFTRKLVDALAPVCGVTVLTAKGTWEPTFRAGYSFSNARGYWAAFLPDLAGLRGIVCVTGGATLDFLDLLGRPLPRSDELPCTRLKDLALVWELPSGACLELEELGREQQPKARGDAEGLCDGAASEDARDEAGRRSLGREVTASLRDLCGALQECLESRARRCEPIRTLSVALRGSYGREIDVQGWQAALVERLLRDALGDLVGEISVIEEVK